MAKTEASAYETSLPQMLLETGGGPGSLEATYYCDYARGQAPGSNGASALGPARRLQRGFDLAEAVLKGTLRLREVA